MYQNKVTLIGNLTRDVELKALPSGVSVASFSVATNRTWKDKAGAKQEQVEYHNVVAFGKQAEVISQYVLKGHQILVEGRLQTRSWDGSDGKKMYRTEVVLENFQFGNNKPSGDRPSAPAKQEQSIDYGQTPEATTGGIDYPEEEINPEDIPF